MDALTGFKLHMLEVMVVIADESTRRNAEKIANIMHVRPDFMGTASGRSSPGRRGSNGSGAFQSVRNRHGDLL
ncbi:hypothetical protein [Noviherbaspirillum pedocola]|uniref:hypothetical protein n=1 Tax=Noviherbaspirillum pedocola TaxID=2801341 RepID=UPI001F3A4BC9|nr:hypothetical protein [Noviherbaspirillum pedocola]